jgi:hypothetical protein
MEPLPALRRKSLLEHFGAIKDDRQRCKVMYRLAEVLLLVVCGTICACDDGRVPRRGVSSVSKPAAPRAFHRVL